MQGGNTSTGLGKYKRRLRSTGASVVETSGYVRVPANTRLFGNGGVLHGDFRRIIESLAQQDRPRRFVVRTVEEALPDDAQDTEDDDAFYDAGFLPGPGGFDDDDAFSDAGSLPEPVGFVDLLDLSEIEGLQALNIPAPIVGGAAELTARELLRRRNVVRDWGVEGSTRILKNAALLHAHALMIEGDVMFDCQVLTDPDNQYPPVPYDTSLFDFVLLLWSASDNSAMYCGIHPQQMLLPHRQAGAVQIKNAGGAIRDQHVYPARPGLGVSQRHTFGGRALHIFSHLLGDAETLGYREMDKSFSQWLHSQIPRRKRTNVSTSTVLRGDDDDDEADVAAATNTWRVYRNRPNIIGLNLYWGLVRGVLNIQDHVPCPVDDRNSAWKTFVGNLYSPQERARMATKMKEELDGPDRPGVVTDRRILRRCEKDLFIYAPRTDSPFEWLQDIVTNIPDALGGIRDVTQPEGENKEEGEVAEEKGPAGEGLMGGGSRFDGFDGLGELLTARTSRIKNILERLRPALLSGGSDDDDDDDKSLGEALEGLDWDFMDAASDDDEAADDEAADDEAPVSQLSIRWRAAPSPAQQVLLVLRHMFVVFWYPGGVLKQNFSPRGNTSVADQKSLFEAILYNKYVRNEYVKNEYNRICDLIDRSIAGLAHRDFPAAHRALRGQTCSGVVQNDGPSRNTDYYTLHAT